MAASLKVGITAEADLPTFADAKGAAIRRGAMRGAERFAARAKIVFRGDIRRAGLGDRLANTWRVDVYPKGRDQSWHPAVHVYSAAPEIIRAHTDGTTIKSKNGVFLAIPTDNVPRRGGRQLSPLDIEGQFNQDLIVRPTNRPGVLIAYVRAVRGKSGRGFRRATKKRLSAGRDVELVPMFILIRQVTLRPVLTPPEKLAESLGGVFVDYVAEEISAELGRQ